MPYFKKRKTSVGWFRVIRDFGQSYPTIDHWIEDVDRRQKWNKKRLKFASNYWRR